MHYGGRLLWQVERLEDLRTAWRIGACFAALETELIDEFRELYGRLPFANLRRGDRLVCDELSSPTRAAIEPEPHCCGDNVWVREEHGLLMAVIVDEIGDAVAAALTSSMAPRSLS